MYDQYKRLIQDKNISTNEVMDYMIKYVPKKLYRYRTFNNFWKNNLFDGEIYLSKPSQFNDPFDGVPNIKINKFWDICGRKIFYDNTGIDIELNMESAEDIFDIIQLEVKQFTQEKMRVACFCEQWNSLLMWAHYADSHKGFCIEYDTTMIPDHTKRFFLPVIYQKQFYDSTYDFEGNQYNSFNFLFHKAQEWEYEKEWRIAVYEKQIRANINLKDSITSVTLGINCPEEYKREIMIWANTNNKAVYQTSVLYDKYELMRTII
ncbi:DUF2971 domain-containing protein [Lacrimispora sp.]|uniref:DUF2971 domain-containing protein n=1 Tax=Lacrimispora sp. TaxID=2719234 RepID=UPI0028B0E241|nr:DUF2971 domain-containing protein [Lacrimispora sp.]